jgi:hypothetical protein
MNITILTHSVPPDIISTRYTLILSYHLHPGLSNGFFHVANSPPHFTNFAPTLMEIITLIYLVEINYEPPLYIFFPNHLLLLLSQAFGSLSKPHKLTAKT